MALQPAPVALRPSRAVLGRRGVPTRIALDLTEALAPCLEGGAFAQEVEASAARIRMAAAAGSRHAVVNEADRLGFLALRARIEFARLAADIEDPRDAA